MSMYLGDLDNWTQGLVHVHRVVIHDEQALKSEQLKCVSAMLFVQKDSGGLQSLLLKRLEDDRVTNRSRRGSECEM